MLRIERSETAHGTNLADKDQPVIRVFDGIKQVAFMGRWTMLCLPSGPVKATEATDEQIREALRTDEPVF